MEMLGFPSRPWSEANRLLAQALTLHDKDLCPGGCGHYLDETCEEDGFHEAETLICDACAARERLTGDPERKREPGELVFVTRPEIEGE